MSHQHHRLSTQAALQGASHASAEGRAAGVGSPGVERAAQQFLEAVHLGGGKPIYQLSIADARAVLDGAQAGEVPLATAEVSEHDFPVGPSSQVHAHIVRPAGVSGPLPAVLYLHGGGWILGNFKTHERLVRELAAASQSAFVFVDYSPSPEVRFPVAVEEAYAALGYIAAHGAELGLDPQRLAVAGDSAGGNLAAAVTLLAQERNGPSLRLQVLFYPVTNADLDSGSYQAFAEGHFLTRNAMQWFWDAYASEAERALPTVSPLQASDEQLRHLPRAVVLTAEFDVLRDEGEAYARRLSAAGVHVTAARFGGAIHDFVMLNAVSQTPAARAAIALASEKLREAFAE
ncbi:MAG: alpha/beta hydrolase [Verrucomicrobiota bacterium JB022]|nr:alpha/beta hydrolase [Verrucomicrobiota bacterium JB022]